MLHPLYSDCLESHQIVVEKQILIMDTQPKTLQAKISEESTSTLSLCHEEEGITKGKRGPTYY